MALAATVLFSEIGRGPVNYSDASEGDLVPHRADTSVTT
jgi:hypothetical protein